MASSTHWGFIRAMFSLSRYSPLEIRVSVSGIRLMVLVLANVGGLSLNQPTTTLMAFGSWERRSAYVGVVVAGQAAVDGLAEQRDQVPWRMSSVIVYGFPGGSPQRFRRKAQGIIKLSKGPRRPASEVPGMSNVKFQGGTLGLNWSRRGGFFAAHPSGASMMPTASLLQSDISWSYPHSWEHAKRAHN